MKTRYKLGTQKSWKKTLEKQKNMFAMRETSCTQAKTIHIGKLKSGYLHPWLLIGDNTFYINIQMFLIVELLSSAVLSAPQILLESTPKVREMLDYLSFLSPMSAESLLMAIHPLLKLSLTLKDSLILILRKSMFSR